MDDHPKLHHHHHVDRELVIVEIPYQMPADFREPPVIKVHEPEDEEEGEDEEADIDELGPDDTEGSKLKSEKKRDSVHLKVEGRGGLRKSLSLTSITSRVKETADRLKNNQIAGVVFFLVLGLITSITSYLMSVYAAELNKQLIETTVQNQETITKKLTRAMAEGPSKYLVGLLNFGGRMLSSIGTVMLVQVIVTYVKRRRYNLVLRSAAGEADQVVGEVHTGVTDAAGELIMNCIQARALPSPPPPPLSGLLLISPSLLLPFDLHCLLPFRVLHLRDIRYQSIAL